MTPWVLFALAVLSVHPDSGRQAAPEDPITTLVARLDKAVSAGQADAVAALVAPDAPRGGVGDFVATISPAASRAVLKERDRLQIIEGRARLLIEIMLERGIEGQISTWRLDIADTGAGWRIAGMERLSVVSGLYRLSLNPLKQFDVRNLTLTGTDVRVEMASGSAFVSETPEGPTAIVLVGRGVMHFTPTDSAEKTQMRLFAGRDALAAEFDGAFIRIKPGEFTDRFQAGALLPRAVSGRDLRRARALFEEFIGQTLQIDLVDMSRERWSLVPPAGDLIVEVRTRKYGNLTYTRAANEAEDISVFQRLKRRNIAAYPSPQKLASRGRFYDEDDLVDYDVLSYDLNATFDPDRLWTAGRARLTVRVQAAAMASMTLRLANTLVVRTVYSRPFGRLLHLRVVGQNSVILNLPTTVVRGTEFEVEIEYNGRLEPQQLDREAIAPGVDGQETQYSEFVLLPEAQYIYSNRSHWYPQAMVSDYATARLQLTVPHGFDVIASGDPVGEGAPEAGVVASGQRPRKVFVFESSGRCVTWRA